MLDLDLLLGVLVALSFLGVVAAASLFWAARRAERRLAAMMRDASSIVSLALEADDPEEALDGLTLGLARMFSADACAISVPTDDGYLVPKASQGFPRDPDLRLPAGKGLVGATFASGLPVVISDVRDEPRYVQWIEGVRSIACVPLRFRNQILGVLVLESRTRRYEERDLAVLVPLAEQVTAALENLELRVAAEGRAEEEEKIRAELQAISSVVMAGVASATDLDGALHSMIKEISARMGWESLAVVLYADDGLLYTRAYYGYPLHSTVVAFTPGQGVIGSVAKTGQGRLVNDVFLDPDYLDLVSETKSEMCVPLYSGKKVIGVLNAESPRRNAFSESDFRVLNTLGRQMAVVIERARLADLERVALERLREADQLKDDFIATVSHELRTPLTSIKGYAQTLLAREDVLSAEDRSSFLGVMVRHCDRLARIVDTLLLVSRLEAGEIGGKPTYMAVTDLLRDAAEAAGGEERVQIEAEHGIGIVTDHFRVHHILRNLLENAGKYSPDRSPVLARATIEGETLMIEVLDQGSGIPPGMESQIFERFRRASDPGRSTVPGTGLGLYIARRFAEDLGGSLTVQGAVEEPWSGARFVLELPTTLGSVDASVVKTERVTG